MFIILIFIFISCICYFFINFFVINFFNYIFFTNFICWFFIIVYIFFNYLFISFFIINFFVCIIFSNFIFYFFINFFLNFFCFWIISRRVFALSPIAWISLIPPLTLCNKRIDSSTVGRIVLSFFAKRRLKQSLISWETRSLSKGNNVRFVE